MKMRRRSREVLILKMDGFTLIELVLIIIVVAVLGAVVALNLSGLSDIKVNNAVNKVVGDLRYAQQLSITTQSRHGLTINAAKDGYSVHVDTGAGGSCGGEPCIKDPTNLGLDFIVNFDSYQQNQLKDVRFTSDKPFCGGGVIEFDKLGAPTDTAGAPLTCAISVQLNYLGGNTKTITIEPNTGNLTY